MKTYSKDVAQNNGFLFDPFFNDFFEFGTDGKFGKSFKSIMKTDVLEDEKQFTLLVDLPGFKKEDVLLELDKGYLTISANNGNADDFEKLNFIRRERVYESCKRTFFVGEDVDEGDVSAELCDGVLKVVVLKREKIQPESKKILIK